jgi:hypothetical protein
MSFKNVAIGYAVGAGGLLGPLILLALISSALVPEGIGLVDVLLVAVMLPLIIVGQGAMIGGIVSLGWWIVDRFNLPWLDMKGQQ